MLNRLTLKQIGLALWALFLMLSVPLALAQEGADAVPANQAPESGTTIMLLLGILAIAGVSIAVLAQERRARRSGARVYSRES